MKYIVILKEFYNKKTTKNYLFILFSLVFLINIAYNFYIYSIKIINNNYKNSYIIVTLNNQKKYNLISNNNKIDTLKKCIVSYDKILVENDNDDFLKNVDRIKNISTLEFNKNEFKDKYIITLNDWINYNNFIDKISKNNIQFDIIILKQDNNNFENYLSYFLYLLIIIIFISLIIYVTTIINIILDEEKNNYLFYCIGYSLIQIKKFLLIKLLTLLVTILLFNNLLQIIIRKILDINTYFNLVINIVLIVSTIIITMFMIIERRKKYEEKTVHF